MVNFWGLKPCYPFNAEANKPGHMRFESDSCFGVKAVTLYLLSSKQTSLKRMQSGRSFEVEV